MNARERAPNSAAGTSAWRNAGITAKQNMATFVLSSVVSGPHVAVARMPGAAIAVVASEAWPRRMLDAASPCP